MTTTGRTDATIQHVLEPMEQRYDVKPTFQQRYVTLLGEKGFAEFMRYSTSFPKRAIRVNTLKISVEALLARIPACWELQQVPWCKEAFWIRHIEGRRDIGNLPEHILGYLYIQEPASMVPPLVLGAQPGDIVLDLCAAPGSKTTQIAQDMQHQGLLIANEYVASRLAPLSMNVQRLGVTNVICTVMDGHRVKDIMFDKILVDAPCSGIGTLSKSPRTLQMWNPGMIRRIAQTQYSLLKHAYTLLQSGGTLVYSTCTTEPEENEGVVTQFLQQHPDMQLQTIDLAIKRSEPITRFEDKIYHQEIHKCLRIWPQDNDTEGFFIAKMTKL
ncbi:MAG: RsmB/NOP family class I SAM-dependent RNA methyltransferase [Candidatus Woesearchaeota archaeon]